MSKTRYFLILLAIFVFVGFGAWRALEQHSVKEQDIAIEAAKQEIATSIRSYAAGLVAEDFNSADRVKQHETFSKIFNQFQSTDTVRMKVWNKDHVVVWSELPETIGQAFPENEEVTEAMQGEVIIELEQDKAEHLTERQFEAFAEVYVPILDSSGAAIGVFEVYTSTWSIQDRLNKASRETWVTVILTALAVVGVAAFFLRRFVLP
jgi:sensor histidine kinase regulating citrate/malate metabolism